MATDIKLLLIHDELPDKECVMDSCLKDDTVVAIEVSSRERLGSNVSEEGTFKWKLAQKGITLANISRISRIGLMFERAGGRVPMFEYSESELTAINGYLHTINTNTTNLHDAIQQDSSDTNPIRYGDEVYDSRYYDKNSKQILIGYQGPTSLNETVTLYDDNGQQYTETISIPSNNDDEPIYETITQIEPKNISSDTDTYNTIRSLENGIYTAEKGYINSLKHSFGTTSNIFSDGFKEAMGYVIGDREGVFIDIISCKFQYKSQMVEAPFHNAIVNYSSNFLGKNFGWTLDKRVSSSEEENATTVLISFYFNDNISSYNHTLGSIFLNAPADLYNVMITDPLYPLNGDYVLEDNIDMSGFAFALQPIGTLTTPFTGTFNGAGYTITITSANISGNYNGFFGYIGSGAVVQDLSLNFVSSIASSGTKLFEDYGTNVSVGSLAAINSGTIQNCTVNISSSVVIGYANIFSSLASSHAGGLVGQNESIISNSILTFTGIDVNIRGNSTTGGITRNTGGLVGYNSGTGADVSGCTLRFNNAVNGTTTIGNQLNAFSSSYDANTGGLVGQNADGKLQGCVFDASGQLSIYSYLCGGGLCGYATGSSITNCSFNNSVTTLLLRSVLSNTSFSGTGCICGGIETDTTISGCGVTISCTGGVTVLSNSITGGFVGYINNTTPIYGISDCSGNIAAGSSVSIECNATTSADAGCGGIIGRNIRGTINNCNITYSNSTTISQIITNTVGGLVGFHNSGSLQNSSATFGNNCIITSPTFSSGGIVGTADANISGCNVIFGNSCTIRLTGTASRQCGGLLGTMLTNCTITGSTITTGTNMTISTSGLGDVGGLIGVASGGTMTGCSGTFGNGTIIQSTSTSSSNFNGVGGLIGRPLSAAVSIQTSSVSFGSGCTITSGFSTVGGICAYNQSGSITNCTATFGTNATISCPSISSTAVASCGGIIGRCALASASITGCTVTLSTGNIRGGTILSPAGIYIGGLCGLFENGIIQNCTVNIPNSSGFTISGNSRIGGLFGFIQRISIPSSSNISGNIGNFTNSAITIKGTSFNIGGMVGVMTASNSSYSFTSNTCTFGNGTSISSTGSNNVSGMIGFIGGITNNSVVSIKNNTCTFGDNTSISGISITACMFGRIQYASGATLDISGCTIQTGNNLIISSVSTASGQFGYGGLIGRIDTTTGTLPSTCNISNCSASFGNNTVLVNNNTITGVGGLIGNISITSSSFTLNIDGCYCTYGSGTTSSILSRFGGLLGYISSSIGTVTMTNCYCTYTGSTTVSANTSATTANVGGMIGGIETTGTATTTITSCYCTYDTPTTLRGTSSPNVGGLIGIANTTTTNPTNVTSCSCTYGNNTLIQAGTVNAGGLIGICSATTFTANLCSVQYGSSCTVQSSISDTTRGAGAIAGRITNNGGTINNTTIRYGENATISSYAVGCMAGSMEGGIISNAIVRFCPGYSLEGTTSSRTSISVPSELYTGGTLQNNSVCGYSYPSPSSLLTLPECQPPPRDLNIVLGEDSYICTNPQTGICEASIITVFNESRTIIENVDNTLQWAGEGLKANPFPVFRSNRDKILYDTRFNNLLLYKTINDYSDVC